MKNRIFKVDKKSYPYRCSCCAEHDGVKQRFHSLVINAIIIGISIKNTIKVKSVIVNERVEKVWLHSCVVNYDFGTAACYNIKLSMLFFVLKQWPFAQKDLM